MQKIHEIIYTLISVLPSQIIKENLLTEISCILLNNILNFRNESSTSRIINIRNLV